MNWKRGLLRLWVVGSLLWFAVATPLIVGIFSEEQQQLDYAGGSKYPLVVYATVWHWPPWEVLAIEAAVPFVVLGVGATIYWIVVGFRRSD